MTHPSSPHGPRRLAAGLVAALLAAGLASPAAPPSRAGAAVAEPAGSPIGAPAGTFWVTSPTDSARRLLPEEPSTDPATAHVVVDTSEPRQAWWGTGAALTDASRLLLRDHPDAIEQLYAPGRATGAQLNMLRLPLTATDFSPAPWTWRWKQHTATPPAQERAAVAMVREQIQKLRPDLRVVGAPWSAPASMKVTGTVRGGSLSAGKAAAYGRLLVSQAAWLGAHGVPLWAATLGNEPGYSSDYPTMTMTDEQMSALARSVGPALGRTRLWAVDHNWSDRARVDTVLDGGRGDFDGAAFHCYSGTPSQMAGLAVPRMMTECTGTDGDWAGTFAWDARNLVVDALAAGSSGLMMWNLALDDQHGPVDHASMWGCKTCRGLLRIAGDTVSPEPEFYTLAHLSRAATPGARVVTATADGGVRVAAFRNPDGSVGVFGHNASGATRTVELRVPGQPDVAYPVGAGELFTYRQAPS
ncbi:MAG: putative glycoside hydrolase [Nocardioides sp.]|nr:putative glycoside hydrolase [Nocardioides sp.]